MAQSPCFLLPLLIPFCFSSISLYLLGNPPWCDRIPSTLVSGYSQTDLPFLNPSPFPPHSKFPVTQVNCAPYYDDIMIPASHGPEQH
jgi:hypothetical protein